MSTITDIAKAITVLAPLLEQTVEWIRGGREPDYLSQLPATMKSQVALAAHKARIEAQAGK